MQLGPDAVPVVGAKLWPSYPATKLLFDSNRLMRRYWAHFAEPLINGSLSNAQYARERGLAACYLNCLFDSGIHGGIVARLFSFVNSPAA